MHHSPTDVCCSAQVQAQAQLFANQPTVNDLMTAMTTVRLAHLSPPGRLTPIPR
jgi:hypothetical protein